MNYDKQIKEIEDKIEYYDKNGEWDIVSELEEDLKDIKKLKSESKNNG